MTVFKNGIEEKYPNEGEISNKKERPVNEGNYFENHDLNQVREKYVRFTVLMEYLNQVMELGRYANVEEFAMRIRDLVIAANRKEEVGVED